MPSIIYDDEVSGAGSSVLGGSRVLYVAWEVTVQGPNVHQPSVWDSELLVAVGHWELGNDLTPGGLISGVGYDEPHWIYTAIGQWVVAPARVGATDAYSLAQYIRWSMTPGTSVHLIVFGDT